MNVLLTRSEALSKFKLSVSTLQNWRHHRMIEGVHYFKVGSRKILYNETLLVDLIANFSDSAAHQRAIANFLASLPSNRNRKTAA